MKHCPAAHPCASFSQLRHATGITVCPHPKYRYAVQGRRYYYGYCGLEGRRDYYGCCELQGRQDYCCCCAVNGMAAILRRSCESRNLVNRLADAKLPLSKRIQISQQCSEPTQSGSREISDTATRFRDDEIVAEAQFRDDEQILKEVPVCTMCPGTTDCYCVVL